MIDHHLTIILSTVNSPLATFVNPYIEWLRQLVIGCFFSPFRLSCGHHLPSFSASGGGDPSRRIKTAPLAELKLTHPGTDGAQSYGRRMIADWLAWQGKPPIIYLRMLSQVSPTLSFSGIPQQQERSSTDIFALRRSGTSRNLAEPWGESDPRVGTSPRLVSQPPASQPRRP